MPARGCYKGLRRPSERSSLLCRRERAAARIPSRCGCFRPDNWPSIARRIETMPAFEEIKPGSPLRGLDPAGTAEVVQVARFGYQPTTFHGARLRRNVTRHSYFDPARRSYLRMHNGPKNVSLERAGRPDLRALNPSGSQDRCVRRRQNRRRSTALGAGQRTRIVEARLRENLRRRRPRRACLT
jgi:hypothetical protein